jgi:membrane associated rhomboid family serine protease
VIVGALRRFGRFWVDFVVGDDWRIAAGVITILAAAALLVSTGSVGTTVLAAGVSAAVFAVAAAFVLKDARRR